jgi:enoyl-CoA hydratase/carnithine racemase
MTVKVTVERRGHILLIGLTRPDKLNAIDPEMLRQLSYAYTRLDQENDLRCGVLWAEGRYFTAGLDLAKVVQALPKEILSPMIPRGNVNPFATSARPCRKPVIAAIEGPCYTAGIELALASQVIVASPSARFIQSEVARGIFPFGGGTIRWPQAVGLHNAYLYLLTADELDATEAHRLGLVQKLVAPGHALDEAVKIAERISLQAPLGVQAAIASVRRAQNQGVRSAFRRLKWTFLRLLLSKDARRGVEAFKARTTAQFQGN